MISDLLASCKNCEVIGYTRAKCCCEENSRVASLTQLWAKVWLPAFHICEYEVSVSPSNTSKPSYKLRWFSVLWNAASNRVFPAINRKHTRSIGEVFAKPQYSCHSMGTCLIKPGGFALTDPNK